VHITVCRAGDVVPLDRYVGSPGATSFHARRFARQKAGDTYLVGWPAGPWGTWKWRGAGVRLRRSRSRPARRSTRRPGRPEELRSRGIGSALIRRAKEPARERRLADGGDEETPDRAGLPELLARYEVVAREAAYGVSSPSARLAKPEHPGHRP
jgi:hypothetical protein